MLDNWDHLTDHAAGLLMPLFANTPVHVLATSRLRLPLANEIPVHLGGLPSSEAATLFIDRAKRLVSGFQDAPDTQSNSPISADVMRICELVGGLPLGVEIAASWVEHFTVAEIGQSIAETPASFEAAPGQAHSLVQRHRGLSQLFEYSWQLLSPSQQQILARCALFRGGFDRAAADQVTESSLSDLSILLNHSLIQRISPGRYDLHPLLQEFAAFKLPKREEAHYGRIHSHTYLQKLLSVPRTRWGTDLRHDFENIRRAWQRAIQNQDMEIAAKTLIEFGDFMVQYGLMADGNALFKEAVSQFEALREVKMQEEKVREQGDQQANRSDALALNELLAELLFQQWTFARAFLGMSDAYHIHYRILDLTDNQEKQIRSHLSLATHHGEMAEWEKADEHFRQVEQLSRSSSDPRHYISAVESRIHINAVHFRGQYKEGIDLLMEMLDLFESLPTPTPEEDPDGRRRQEDVRLHSQLYQSLALVSVRYRDYALSIWAAGRHLDMLDREGMDHLRSWALLDLALAEQFAGLYDEAITHNLEALATARESGAMDDVGLLQANLCLTLRQAGRLEEALERGREGARVLGQLKLTRMEGQVRNRVGHTLLAMQRWEEAYAAYNEALTTWEPLNHANRFEAMAGKALVGWRLGKKAEALALVADVRRFVTEEGLAGVVEPLFLLLNCAGVLREAGCLDEATEVVDMGQSWIKTVTDRISDPAVRDAFRNRPDCRAIQSPLCAGGRGETGGRGPRLLASSP